MSEPFDPYSQWLGISPHELPADHYRLLGLTRFESDPQVIDAAADQRMLHIRQFQTGPRGVHTQKLLNELATARVCLMNPGSKASYDQWLEGLFLASAPPPQSAIPEEIPTYIPEFPTYVPEVVIEFPDQPIRDSNATGWVVGALAGLVVVTALIAVATIAGWVVVSPQPQPPRRTSESDPVRYGVPERVDFGIQPVVVRQESDGTLNFSATYAQLHGPTIRRGISGNVDVITDWESLDDWASWNFQVVTLPPQGIFTVHVTYAAHSDSDGGKFVLEVGDQQRVCDVRGTGEPVTDEYFLAVPRNGEHTLAVRAQSKPATRLMTLKSVTFSFPSNSAPQ